MQSYAITVLLLATSTLGYRDVSLMDQQIETTTVNDLDNSVYPGNDTPEPEAVPPFPAHMPTTGCFKNIPAAQEVEPTNTNNLETPTNYPQPQLPLLDPVPPQYTPFGSGRPFNRPMTPSFGPGPYGYRNYYPFNRPFAPPMPFSPNQRFNFPNQPNSHHPIVIVKLLQPIILPVAKPMFPEGGDRNPDVDEVDSERYTNGFPRGHGFHRFNSNRRFGAEKYRSLERPMPYRQNTFGPYKIGGGEENIHITVKLH